MCWRSFRSRAARLVQKEHLRTIHQRARDRDPLLLPARKLVRILPRLVGELDHLENLVHPLLDLRLRLLRELQRKRDVIPNRHRREERVVLEDRVDAALVRRQVRNVLAFEVDSPGIRTLKASEHAQQSRLAAARRTEQREELAFVDGKANVVDCSQRTKPLRHMIEDKEVVVHRGANYTINGRAKTDEI